MAASRCRIVKGKGEGGLLSEGVCEAGCSPYRHDDSLLLGVLGNKRRNVRE